VTSLDDTFLSAPIGRPWTDPGRPQTERIERLVAAMTLEEKVAQLGGARRTASAGHADRDPASTNVGPMQDLFARHVDFDEATRHGLGHITRAFGSAPVEPGEGAAALAEMQLRLMTETRLGIPAIAHEECLTGFTTYGATVYPASIAWGATFNPDLVETMAHAIGSDMRAVGAHQGLSPVLDVVRDYRWGRVEETLGEDPYLVAMLGTAYVKGLESAGVIATLKHFAGYSASRGGRNHAPVAMGPRELRDVILPPFEMAVREGRARSVMNSYSEVDGVPAAANRSLLTSILRDEWGFVGTVVSDYWAIAFLKSTHGIAHDDGEAGALALRAGIDIELPDALCFGARLVARVADGAVPEELVDRAVRRVLRQKLELGLLDDGWSPQSSVDAAAKIQLDSAGNRAVARTIAEQSIVLLDNAESLLPLSAAVSSIAVVGPCGDDPQTFFGCYSFPNHVLPAHPSLPLGIDSLSFRQSLEQEMPDTAVVFEQGCPIRDEERGGFAAAADAAARAAVCIAVVGDRAGLFGRGTSGEGCDAADLSLPGVQDELVEVLLATGTPVVLLVVSGRPYALGRYVGRAAAIVQAFFPGEEGGPALAGALAGRVVPSGKLPVQVPALPGGQPGTYLSPPLGRHSEGVSSFDPTPAFPFGHGLSYTTFAYSDLSLSKDEITAEEALTISFLVTNTGQREAAEVAQLYVGDPVAQVTRPVLQLAGFARVSLLPGQHARISFELHAERLAFTGLDLHRIVEPGLIEISIGGSAGDRPLRGSFEVTGAVRQAGRDRVLTTPVQVTVGHPPGHVSPVPGQSTVVRPARSPAPSGS
jgi:beta-xylosidase